MIHFSEVSLGSTDCNETAALAVAPSPGQKGKEVSYLRKGGGKKMQCSEFSNFSQPHLPSEVCPLSFSEVVKFSKAIINWLHPLERSSYGPGAPACQIPGGGRHWALPNKICPYPPGIHPTNNGLFPAWDPPIPHILFILQLPAKKKKWPKCIRKGWPREIALKKSIVCTLGCFGEHFCSFDVFGPGSISGQAPLQPGDLQGGGLPGTFSSL